MPELARRIASRLRQFVGERRRARRAVVRLPFTVSLSTSHLGSNGSRRQASLDGHTFDISATGLGLVVPAIRIGEHYLTGEDKTLLLKMDLPDGAVEMKVVPVRYESLDEHKTEQGYLVGVRIIEITPEHQAVYIHHVAKFLKGGKQVTRRL
jgi:c-di-GMP-binding flagellar brake protein YcgR